MTRGRRKQQAAAPFAVPVLLLALIVSTVRVQALTAQEFDSISTSVKLEAGAPISCRDTADVQDNTCELNQVQWVVNPGSDFEPFFGGKTHINFS